MWAKEAGDTVENVVYWTRNYTYNSVEVISKILCASDGRLPIKSLHGFCCTNQRHAHLALPSYTYYIEYHTGDGNG